MSMDEKETGKILQPRVVTQVVPWCNKKEFKEVYAAVFSENIFDMRWAVDRLALWESRCYPGIDMGFDATAAIVRAKLQDKLYHNNTSFCEKPDLKLLYSIALIRFINVVSEVVRSENVSVPVRVSALKLGIPEWVVHLRHDASHSNIPSLPSLQSGCAFALEWLRTNFWENANAVFVDFYKIKDLTNDAIDDNIAKFMRAQYELLFRNTSEDSKRAARNFLRGNSIQMQAKIKKYPKNFMNALLKPGFLLPNAQDLNEIINHIDGNYDELFVDIQVADLPSSLQEIWMPVIQLLIQTNNIQEFAELLLQHQNAKDLLHQKTVVCWAVKLLQKEPIDSKDSLFYGIPEENIPSFNWARLLGVCVDNCCTFTPALLPIIVDNVEPPLSAEKKSFLMALVAIYLGATTSRVKSTENFKFQNPFTVEKVKEDLKIRKEQRDTENIWHEVPDTIDWSSLPLGYVFNSTSDSVADASFLQTDEAMDTSVPAENVIPSDVNCFEEPTNIGSSNDQLDEIEITPENKNIDVFPVVYHTDMIMLYPPKWI